MKVVHIVANDTGGAARAAIRISNALTLNEVDSVVLVLHKSTNSNNRGIAPCIKNRSVWNAFKVIRKINNMHINKYNLTGVFYEARFGLDLLKLDIVKSADVINLHWINDGMLSHRTLRKLLLSGKKIVWTMHDMFPFTAGCYYDSGCGQFADGCKKCPLAKSNIKIETFIRKQYEIKKKGYDSGNIAFVGCSNWIADSAKKSELVNEKNVVAISNTIDTDVFKPLNKQSALNEYCINTNKKIILFGAASADSDPRKGFEYLKDALAFLDRDKYLSIVFGNSSKVGDTVDGFEMIGVGRVISDEKLAQLYSLADVFVAPSKQENLSNAVMESLACGTPVVAFEIGGMPDMIVHKKNGYLATPFSAEDLAYGMDYCLNTSMKNECRNYVLANFSMTSIGRKYYEFYQRK
ncbi:glycosyltransferase [Clostridium sp. 001]|uniref:glycosyltransferase n=1 Tax=Clostridium sp. 001 TaxID=1970093 RepID=UPI001C2BEA6C|nr:glycosyltransferase [Clostridium sp. 001]